MEIVAIKNRLPEYLRNYAEEYQIKYSNAVKKLAESVNRNHRYIYAIANGNSQASAELQFAISNFFNASVEDIFLPVLSGISERTFNLSKTGTEQ